MDRISREELHSFCEPGPGPRVSIYLPLQHGYPQARENPARLSEALEKADHQLRASSFPMPEGANLFALLAPAFGLSAQDEFWRGCRAESLAVLLEPGECKVYLLPFSCTPSIDVGPHFRLAPLVRLAAWPNQYFLLALSLNAARLYQGSLVGLAPLELPAGTPENFSAFVAGTEVGRAVRFQSAVGAGARPLIHGGSSHADDFEVRREEYCRAVAHGVASYTARTHDVPLVLAAAEELHPIFRTAYSGGNLLEAGLFGCPDHLSEVDLRGRAERLVESQPNGSLALAKEQLRRSKGKTAESIEKIVAAAVEGRVHSLLLVLDGRIWGQLDAETGGVHVDTVGAEGPAKSEDLTELALRETLRHGGQVFAIPPEEADCATQVAAVLRW